MAPVEPDDTGAGLSLVAIAEVKDLVDTLAELAIDPLHMHVDGRKPTDSRPRINVWMRYRTDIERLAERLGRPVVEARTWAVGQRSFEVERDTDRRRLLIQCVSFEHHPDWVPPEEASNG